MIGAIVGDICGSIYEGHNIKTKDFKLITEGRSHFTDDTVMTIAVAQGLLAGGTPEAFVAALQKFGRAHPHAGYGRAFKSWFMSDNPQPYNSWGNGSAMRVSPCAWYGTTLAEVEQLAATSAAVTHNHPEGIKGAQAVAGATFLARKGASKAEIREYVANRYGYDLGFTLDEIRPFYEFDVSCQGSVPEAIVAFLESTDYKDAIRNAISIGGDSDTIAAICGAIAEAAYGMPPKLTRRALALLTPDLTAVLDKWHARVGNGN